MILYGHQYVEVDLGKFVGTKSGAGRYQEAAEE
jgi:hypothetical protein